MTPRKIGPYLVVEELHDRPHATLYLAIDAQQGRELVVKLLKATEYTDPTIRARFQMEAQLLNSLGNPAILGCEDFGEQDGRLYIAMRRMPGGSLADSLHYGALPAEEAARIFQHLAPALDAAHGLGILHGDIKASNILFDENDLPVLADFGMANLLRAQVDPDSDVLIGPPAYLSPEAALAGAKAPDPLELEGVGPASDRYMLGAVLFEMLTGQAPYQAATSLGLAAQHVSQPIPSVCSLQPELSPAWDEMFQYALAKDPASRYTSAIELSAAVSAIAAQPTFSGTQVAAPIAYASELPATLKDSYVLQDADYKATLVEPASAPIKPAGKRRGGLIFTGMLLVLVLAATGLLFAAQGKWLPQGVPGTQEQVSSEIPSPSQTSVETTLEAAVLPSRTPVRLTATPAASATPAPPTATPSPTLPPSPTPIIATAVAASNYTIQYNDTLFTIASQFHVDLAEMLGMNGLSCDSRLAVSKSIIIPPAYPYSDPTAYHPVTSRNFDQLTLEHIVDCAAKINALEFSPDGKLLAAAEDKYIYLWNVGDWKPYLRLKGHTSDVTSVAFSPDGLTLASGSYDGTVRLWKVSNGELQNTLKGHGNQVTDVAFHPGGQQLVSTSRDYTARLWQIDGTPLHQFKGYLTFSAVYAPNGQTLAVGYADSVRIYQLSDLSEISRLPSADVVSHLVYSPDSTLLASSSDLWHVTEGRQIYHFQSSGDAPAFTSDGLALFTGRKVWKVANGTLLHNMVSPLEEAVRTGDVWDSLAFSQDYGLLAWGTPEGLYIYSLPSGAASAGDASSQLHVATSGDNIYNIASDYQVDLQKFLALNGISCNSPIFPGQNLWIPDNAALTGGRSQLEQIKSSNASRLSALRSFSMNCTLTNSDLYFSANSQKLVSGSSLWDITTGAINYQSTIVPRNFDGSPDPNLKSPLLVISPDQKTLAVRAGNDIQLWEVTTGRFIRTLSGHKDTVTSMVYSPDGGVLISGSGTGEQKIIFWNPEDGTQVKVLEGWTVSKLTYSQDGQYLIGEGDDAVRIWRMSDDRLVYTLQGVVGDIAYSPDGLLLAFASCSEKEGMACVKELVSLYKVSEGKVSWSAEGFTADINDIRFSPDGQTIAYSAGNGILIVNTNDGLIRHRLYESGNLVDVADIHFSADGSLLFSTWVDRTLRIWDTQNGSLIHSVHGQSIDRMAFSPDNTMWVLLSKNVITIWGIK